MQRIEYMRLHTDIADYDNSLREAGKNGWILCWQKEEAYTAGVDDYRHEIKLVFYRLEKGQDPSERLVELAKTVISNIPQEAVRTEAFPALVAFRDLTGVKTI